jgi:tRNA dimethylallyltransferase
MRKVLAIVGPTAVGKTKLSIELAKQFNGEIISGDSMQVYRQLDIGTAKVTPAEMDGVQHHLIDIRDVQERFSASDFKEAAKALIEDIADRGKLPIIAGGTGFYLQALLDDLELGGGDEDREKVEQIRAELNQKSDAELLTLLKAVDPVTFATIEQGHRRRVIRAIEVYQATGRRLSEQTVHQSPYDSLLIGLNTDRPQLYERINQRVELMLQAGLEAEAKRLLATNGVVQANKGIGYREWQGYFDGAQTLAETIELIQKNSRHYAKRQLTWFRNKMQVNWYDLIQNPASQIEINQKIESWLAK